MTDHERGAHESDVALRAMFAPVPDDLLDTAEIDGGLTWRQTALLATTSGYLRIPGDEIALPPFNARQVIRQSVDQSFKVYVGENRTPKSAKDAVVFCLEVAADEYTKLCESAAEWSTDKRLVDCLLGLWRRDDVPFVTETLASNVLYLMYNNLKRNE